MVEVCLLGFHHPQLWSTLISFSWRMITKWNPDPNTQAQTFWLPNTQFASPLPQTYCSEVNAPNMINDGLQQKQQRKLPRLFSSAYFVGKWSCCRLRIISYISIPQKISQVNLSQSKGQGSNSSNPKRYTLPVRGPSGRMKSEMSALNLAIETQLKVDFPNNEK